MADRDDMPFDSFVGVQPGDSVGGYELLRELGRGGMAEVWLARRMRSSAGKFVAIKMILPQYVGVERYSRMFAAEAEVAAPLSHSNICQVFDEGEDHGRSYIVMEWVDGADLAQLLPAMAELRRRDPQLRLRLAAYIVGQVLHGLSYAHKVQSHRGRSLGIVHRDISPQNVLVSVSGDVKVTDFGIAHRMIEETTGINVKGKLRYMAPEQLAGHSHAPTVDLYAVGAILHELLEGEKFRSGADDHAALYHHVMSGRVPAVASDVPPELDAVRRALLDADPAKRPQTADAAVLMLKRWVGYSEMRAELGIVCGLATGVVRPRLGPIVAPGQSTVPPRGAGRSSPVLVRPQSPEPDAPIARWGESRESTTVLAEGEHHSSLRPKSEPTIGFVPSVEVLAPMASRDLEPTHSVVDAPVPVVERTISQLDVTVASRSVMRPWMLLLAAAVLAVLGATATALVLAHEPASDRAATPQPELVAVEAASTEVIEPEVVGPELSPPIAEPPIVASTRAAVIAPEPSAVAVPAAEASATVVEPASRSTTEPAAKPTAKPAAKSAVKAAAKRAKQPASREPTGPEVTVHFRLERGLAGADIKLGRRVIAVRPRYDGRVPSGTYSAMVRTAAGEDWRAVGEIRIGASGEWKLVLGAKSALLSKL